MMIRFGYVANALSLWDSSPSKTVTFTNWKRLDKDNRLDKLQSTAKNNLNNTIRALHFNIAHGLPLYRLSSSIIPLATHPEVNWDYISPFRSEYEEIGRLVKQHNMRASFHPNQFTLFTSDKDHVTENAVSDLVYHYNVLEAMGLEKTSIINLHVGGAYGDKPKAIERFHENIKTIPGRIKQQITLENDDKVYNAEETLAVCLRERIPMIFDYHHHVANPCETALDELLPEIFATWSHTSLRPKVHLSSPKTEDAFRSHHDFVSKDFILSFLKLVRSLGIDIDVMIEAKQKDKAALQLLDELEKVRGFKRVGGGTISL